MVSAPPSAIETSAAEEALKIAAAKARESDAAQAAPPSEPELPRIDRMIAAGFSRIRAEEILRREAQLRVDASYAEYAATGTVSALNGSARAAGAEQLRAELGDGEYERYLDATGQPTRVVVGSVESDTAAANAGLLPGDEITSYGGRRVFNLRELNALMLQRSPGETVAVTVVRDGQPLHLYLVGGPLGLAQPAPPR